MTKNEQLQALEEERRRVTEWAGEEWFRVYSKLKAQGKFPVGTPIPPELAAIDRAYDSKIADIIRRYKEIKSQQGGNDQ